MDNSEEIEVEVVEVVNERPATQPSRPAPRPAEPASDGSQRPFGRGIPIRSLRISAWMWPLAIILGLILFLLAVVVGLIIVIPFLIIRGIVRLLLGPSR